MQLKRMKVKSALIFLLIALLANSLFSSCKKSRKSPADTSEYIHYVINGTAYNFDMPVDSVFADSVVEASTFTSGKNVYGKRNSINTADFVRVIYNIPNTQITVGSQATLYSFYTMQTGLYPQYTTSATPVIINFIEIGMVNEYMAGNFSATLIGPAPSNTVFVVKCDFRVRRRI